MGERGGASYAFLRVPDGKDKESYGPAGNLPQPDSGRSPSQYMQFIPAPTGMKTKRWWVYGNRGGLLGEIRWFGRWRQYTFFPCGGTTFSVGCMEELAEFLRAHAEERNP